MSQHVITKSPTWSRYRTTFISIAVFTLLALGVGVAVAALVSDGSESAVSRSAPATEVVPVTGGTCPTDVENLLATIVAMPPSVSAQVVRGMAPDMSQGLGNLVLYIKPGSLPPAPDATTLGALLGRLDPVDRNAVMRGSRPSSKLRSPPTNSPQRPHYHVRCNASLPVSQR